MELTTSVSTLRRVKKMKAVSLAALCALVLSSCTADFAENNGSNVLLLITDINGDAGAGPDAGQETAQLLSDVVTEGGVINDNAVVGVRVENKNPTVTESGTFNDVYLHQYRVQFHRTDGHNAEGIDVPYGFSGPLSLRVSAGGTGSTSFIVVRHEAKREPPLRNMWGGGGHEIMQVIATITVYGTTTAGQEVSAQGQLEVTFADFADE
jgi:hypothetical protein